MNGKSNSLDEMSWTKCLEDQPSHLEIWRCCWTSHDIVDNGDAHTAINFALVHAVRIEGSPLYHRLIRQGRKRPVVDPLPSAMPHRNFASFMDAWQGNDKRAHLHIPVQCNEDAASETLIALR